MWEQREEPARVFWLLLTASEEIKTEMEGKAGSGVEWSGA